MAEQKEKKIAREIIFINTVSKEPDFLPYTGSSIKKGKLPENPKTLDTIEKIVDSNVEISDAFKEKSMKYLNSSKTADVERISKLKEALDKAEINNKFYQEFKARPLIENLVGSKRVEEWKKETEEMSALQKTVVEQLTNEEELRNKEDQEIEDVKAELQIKAALDEREIEVPENFFGLKDDLLEATKHDGYTEKQIQDVYDSLKNKDKNEVIKVWGEILRNLKPLGLKKSLKLEEDPEEEIVPTPLTLQEEEIMPVPQLAEPDTVAGLLAAPDAQMPNQDDPEAPEAQQAPATGPMTEKKETVYESGTGKRPFIKRYHEKSILLYFNNSSYPDWDTTLEANIMKMKATREEIVSMMEDIIAEYGKKIFVSRRKSDTKEELNELIQLQFCVLRNLQLGPRAKTANVKLSDLVKIDQLANNQTNPRAAGAAGPQLEQESVIVNPTRVLSSSEPATMTRSEDAFIRNFDNYQVRRNLNLRAVPPRVQPTQTYTGSDPRNVAIIPGNNLISIERTPTITNKKQFKSIKKM